MFESLGWSESPAAITQRMWTAVVIVLVILVIVVFSTTIGFGTALAYVKSGYTPESIWTDTTSGGNKSMGFDDKRFTRSGYGGSPVIFNQGAGNQDVIDVQGPIQGFLSTRGEVFPPERYTKDYLTYLAKGKLDDDGVDQALMEKKAGFQINKDTELIDTAINK